MQRTQLFITDLPLSVDENFLKMLFGDYGEISSIVLKKKENYDKCFCFLTFSSANSALKAMNEMNYTKIDGLPLRIMWGDAETKKIKQSGKGNLFISGLDEAIEVSQLHEAFLNFGEVVSCKISLTKQPNGEYKSNGYGYVQFSRQEDADRAIKDLSDASINNRRITIQPYIRQHSKSPSDVFTNIYIKGFPSECYQTEDDLMKLFSDIGEVQSIKLQKSLSPGFQDLPYAFCNFYHHEDAIRAIQEFNGKEIKGSKLFAGRAMTKRERSQMIKDISLSFKKNKYENTKGRNLYFKNISLENTEDELKEYFSQFGQIESLVINRESDPPYNSKQFGFVCFETDDYAQEAIKGSTYIKFNGSFLFVSLMQRKVDRIRIMQQNYSEWIQINEKKQKEVISEVQVDTSLQDRKALIDMLLKEEVDLILIQREIKQLSNDQIKRLMTNTSMVVRYAQKIKDKKITKPPKKPKPVMQSVPLEDSHFPDFIDSNKTSVQPSNEAEGTKPAIKEWVSNIDTKQGPIDVPLTNPISHPKKSVTQSKHKSVSFGDQPRNTPNKPKSQNKPKDNLLASKKPVTPPTKEYKPSDPKPPITPPQNPIKDEPLKAIPPKKNSTQPKPVNPPAKDQLKSIIDERIKRKQDKKNRKVVNSVDHPIPQVEIPESVVTEEKIALPVKEIQVPTKPKTAGKKFFVLTLSVLTLLSIYIFFLSLK